MHNLDVEVAASGFTRDMSKSFDEVCEFAYQRCNFALQSLAN